MKQQQDKQPRSETRVSSVEFFHVIVLCLPFIFSFGHVAGLTEKKCSASQLCHTSITANVDRCTVVTCRRHLAQNCNDAWLLQWGNAADSYIIFTIYLANFVAFVLPYSIMIFHLFTAPRKIHAMRYGPELILTVCVLMLMWALATVSFQSVSFHDIWLCKTTFADLWVSHQTTRCFGRHRSPSPAVKKWLTWLQFCCAI